MQTFDTPAPISARLELTVAEVTIDASERPDTTVEVRPADPGRPADVETADRTTVEFDDGTLHVASPKQRVRLGRNRTGSVVVAIGLPAGSRVKGSIAVGTLASTGRLGDCDLTAASGDVRLAEVADLTTSVGAGSLQVERVTGRATVGGAAGQTRIGHLHGPAVVKGAVGVIRIGTADDHLRIASAGGDIAVERALAPVVAKTAAGRIVIGEAHGRAEVETGGGSVSVGIPAGTAAWVDARSVLGQVRNELRATGAPGEGEPTVEVRARTTIGDIRIFRAEQTEADRTGAVTDRT